MQTTTLPQGIETMEVTITGTKPLLMHAGTTIDPTHPLTKAIKEVSGKRTKTDEDHAQMADLEYRAALYMDEQGPALPETLVMGSFVGGAKLFKLGTALQRAVIGLTPIGNGTDMPLLYNGPRTADALVNDPEFRDVRAVGIQGKRIMRTRPRFNRWALSFTLTFDSTQMSRDQIVQCMEAGGRFIGMGDGRKIGFGRFEVAVS